MTNKLIGVEGDTEEQNDIPLHGGGGVYPVQPVTLQSFLYINNKLVIPNGQTYPAHEIATMVASGQSYVYVDGKLVCVEGDIANNPPHTTYGLNCIGQNFVFIMV
jgi:uncharacterized Zn-binding protein involved in type VI secretion